MCRRRRGRRSPPIVPPVTFNPCARPTTRPCDAWARAQLIKTGPLSLFLRYERFAYWPEARNVTQRMLDALIASNDPKELAPETLVRDSVAAQGLTALERLLYDGDILGCSC